MTDNTEVQVNDILQEEITRPVKNRSGWKREEEEYTQKFLSTRKVKDYTPVYIDVQLKEKLHTLINSLQYIAPDITPTMLLSNMLAEHISTNKDLIKRVANEGLKRSLEHTFNEDT